jgi:hypothetical protein
MALTTSTPIPTQDRENRDQSDTTSKLESLTVSYMSGEIDLKSYREKLRTINTRLDLRRIAHKIWRTRSE